jgi:alpha-1,2-mannosyltransferase
VIKWLALGAVCAALIAAGVLAFRSGWPTGGDTAVYRAGAIALLEGTPLYDADVLPAEPDWARLPFTYPPTAALLFVPLVLVPIQVAWGISMALSALAMVAVLWVILHRLPRRPAWLSPGPGSVALGIGLLVIEPVRVTLEYGQINVILMALVVLDVLVLGGNRHCGVLIGIAAAVKLTPLIFVAQLALIGRRADAARAAGTFLGLQGLLWLLSGHDLVRYWTKTVHDPTRIGPVYGLWNQSLSGILRRLTDMAGWAQPAAYLLGVLVLVPAAWLVLRFHRLGRPVNALLVTAFAGLVVSPVSWLHHWVWVAPLVVVLLAEACCGNRIARWLLPIVAIGYLPPTIRTVHTRQGDEFDWGVGEFVVGNEFVLIALLAGVVLVTRHIRASRRRLEPAQVG